jgi:two-component system nitrate/nitrite response regulator NarP
MTTPGRLALTRLLIADDHPIVLSGIEGLLRGTSYQVVATVRDGAAVLEVLPTARPDILLMDVNMPHRSGLDVLRTLRNRSDTRPIVLLTASLESADAIEAIQLGVNGVVLKETAPDLLLGCLDAVKSGRRWIERSVLEGALAMSLSDETRGAGPLAALSAKERAIVRLVSQGLRNKEVASELGVTEGTVKVHLHNIYDKLNVSNRTELAVLARERG